MARQYKEFSLDGKELASYRHSVSPYDDAGIALCDDGGVWLSVKADSTGKTGDTMLVSLNRDLGTWSMGKNQPGGVYLLGCAALHDQRPQEQRANAAQKAYTKEIQKAVKQIEKDRKKENQ
jgi:hypothetical protein